MQTTDDQYLALEVTLLMHLHTAENLLIIPGLPPLESLYNLKQKKGGNPSTRFLKE